MEAVVLRQIQAVTIAVAFTSIVLAGLYNLPSAFALSYPPALTVDSDNVTYAANEPVAVSGKVSGELRDLAGEDEKVSWWTLYSGIHNP